MSLQILVSFCIPRYKVLVLATLQAPPTRFPVFISLTFATLLPDSCWALVETIHALLIRSKFWIKVGFSPGGNGWSRSGLGEVYGVVAMGGENDLIGAPWKDAMQVTADSYTFLQRGLCAIFDVTPNAWQTSDFWILRNCLVKMARQISGSLIRREQWGGSWLLLWKYCENLVLSARRKKRGKWLGLNCADSKSREPAGVPCLTVGS